MDHSIALAGDDAVAAQGGTCAPSLTDGGPPARIWRARLAVAAFFGLSFAGYALIFVAIDQIVRGRIPGLF